MKLSYFCLPPHGTMTKSDLRRDIVELWNVVSVPQNSRVTVLDSKNTAVRSTIWSKLLKCFILALFGIVAIPNSIQYSK